MIARLDAEREQRAGHVPGAVGELAVGEADVREDERLVVGIAAGAAQQQVPERHHVLGEHEIGRDHAFSSSSRRSLRAKRWIFVRLMGHSSPSMKRISRGTLKLAMRPLQ